MRPEEVQGNPDQEEGRTEACRNRAVAARNRILGQRLERLGNHEVHQGPGNEPVVGIAAAAGLEGNRRGGKAAAAGQAGRGTEEAAGSGPADGVAVAVAEQGGLTAINVSLSSTLFQLFMDVASARLRRRWTAGLHPHCRYASGAMATYPPKLHPYLKSSSSWL